MHLVLLQALNKTFKFIVDAVFIVIASVLFITSFILQNIIVFISKKRFLNSNLKEALKRSNENNKKEITIKDIQVECRNKFASKSEYSDEDCFKLYALYRYEYGLEYKYWFPWLKKAALHRNYPEAQIELAEFLYEIIKNNTYENSNKKFTYGIKEMLKMDKILGLYKKAAEAGNEKAIEKLKIINEY